MIVPVLSCFIVLLTGYLIIYTISFFRLSKKESFELLSQTNNKQFLFKVDSGKNSNVNVSFSGVLSNNSNETIFINRNDPLFVTKVSVKPDKSLEAFGQNDFEFYISSFNNDTIIKLFILKPQEFIPVDFAASIEKNHFNEVINYSTDTLTKETYLYFVYIPSHISPGISTVGDYERIRFE